VITGLVVNVDKMRSNLDLLGGFLLSERVMFALSGKVGKQTAHELVYEISMHGLEKGIAFDKALMAPGNRPVKIVKDGEVAAGLLA